MLQDKDRVFTNLYGLYDPGLDAARKRGDWDNTKAIIEKGREWIVEEMNPPACGAAAAPASQLA